MRHILQDFFRPFTGSQVSDLYAFAKEMAVYGLTTADILTGCKEYFDEKINEIEAMPAPQNGDRGKPPLPRPKAQLTRPTSICPDCGDIVRISPVNVSKCTEVGGDWHTSLMCINPQCRFTELSTKTIDEWR